MRYFIKLAYKGTNYFGWQVQKGQKSIQAELSRCLSLLSGEDLLVQGAGRTDTGVHAKQMYAHFDAAAPIGCEELVRRLNSFLGPDIAVYDVFAVKPEASARFSALSRSYKYFIEPSKNPFSRDYCWHLYKHLDLGEMNRAAEALLSYKDFECFSRSNSSVNNYLCEILYVKWEKDENDMFVFTIKANRFLRNMVRAIVGTMVEVGLKKLSVSGFKRIIESKKRSMAGESAPPEGLFLWEIDYPDDIYL